jgi:colanic acid/amylovoran biosynthesis protein
VSVFELQGVNFENKGAELMLIAAGEHFAATPGMPRLAMPFRIGTPAQREAANMAHLVALHRDVPLANTLLDIATALLPRGVRNARQIYGRGHMGGLIDAAGFRYSDQWPIESIAAQAEKTARLKRQNKPVVYLPQAFGPFASDRAKGFMRTVIDNADLVFARDKVSYQHLVGAAGEQPQIRRAPDFTNLVAPRFDGEPLPDNVVFIVPNSRMMDKTTPEIAAQYIKSLA